MAKKNFSDINTDDIYSSQIAEATAEVIAEPIPRQKKGELPSKDIVEQARQQGKTQGRKGCGAHRFNMAFSPKAYEFITTMARVRGETITAFTNHIIEQAAEEHAEIFQQALKFKESL